MYGQRINAAFVQFACGILAETEHGLSGSEIVKVTCAHAVEHGRNLPHPRYPFVTANKRTALYDNLMAFDGPQQVRILLGLCDHPKHSAASIEQRKQLKLHILRDYGHWAQPPPQTSLDVATMEETRHWLQAFPDSRRLYDDAIRKRTCGVLERNLLDDLRLSLELLVKQLLQNSRSLENQLPAINAYMASRGGSTEIGNVVHKLIDLYTVFQNKYVKHNDAVKSDEVDIAVEWTVMIMRHLLRLHAGATLVPAPPPPPAWWPR